MQKKNIKVNLLSEKGVVPTRAHKTDSGYDITFTGVSKIVGDVIFFKTDISLQPPSGYYFEVVPRSSISKLPLEMANSIGVIDESYTGEIIVPVRVTHSNLGQGHEQTSFPNGIVKIFGTRPPTMSTLANLIIYEKPKLFQAILRKRFDCNFVVDTIEDTERGAGGFGSSDWSNY